MIKYFLRTRLLYIHKVYNITKKKKIIKFVQIYKNQKKNKFIK